MILSTGRRFVFVHIPKTGGTSVAMALEARAMKDDIMLGDTPKARRRRHRVQGMATAGRLWKHATLGDIEGLVPDTTLDGLFAFTVVRNPWDRLVSYYHWLLTQDFDHPSVELAKSMSFDGFAGHNQTLAALHANPAASYMQRSDGRIQCNAFVRIEAFAQDAAALFDHLGFKFELPVLNTSDRNRDHRSYYSTELAEQVAKACARDISDFGYTFDSVNL
ncbi:MAG: sulfotransferase family 2 domain-containing protein [Sedimentitalea sp.]